MKVPVEGRILLAVDFMAKTVITSIKTQGVFNQEAWVTTFKFAFLYGDSIIGYEKNKVYMISSLYVYLAIKYIYMYYLKHA